MAVLMSGVGAAGGPGGGERRCDGTCHNAKRPTCVCICGGRYHGKGAAKASEEHQADVEQGVWGSELQQLARTGSTYGAGRIQPLVFRQEVGIVQQIPFTFV